MCWLKDWIINFNLIISQTQTTRIFSSSWAVLRQAHTNDCPENFLDVQTAVYLQYVYSLCLEGKKKQGGLKRTTQTPGRGCYLEMGNYMQW